MVARPVKGASHLRVRQFAWCLGCGTAHDMNDGFPDFYVVGAPKCGTTALYEYLSDHDRIFMPFIKEPHYFGFDLEGIARVKDEGGYKALFAAAPTDAVVGEASATYLFSKVAVANIMAARPDARIIVMLRRPVDAVRSYHLQLLKGLLEDVEDFETAWRLQDDRLAGRRMPPDSPDPSLLQYGATFRYANQVERVIAVVPEEQRLFLIYEEFFADPASSYGRVLSFLGIEPDGRTEFKVFNPAASLKSRTFARFYLSPPSWLRVLWSPFRVLSHRLGISIPEILQRLNTAPAGKAPLTAGLRSELNLYFEDDIAQTEHLLGRSLSLWRA